MQIQLHSSALLDDLTDSPGSHLTSESDGAYIPFPSTKEQLSYPFQMTDDFLLPPPGQHQRKIRVRTLLGHCLYRRVIIWTITLLSLLSLTLYSSGSVVRTTGRILNLVDFSKNGYWGGVVGVKKQVKASGILSQQGIGNDLRLEKDNKTEPEPPHWLRYRQ